MLRKSAFMSSKESSTSIMCCFEVLVQSVPGQPSCHMSVIVKALVSKVCSPKSSAPRTWSSWFSCSTYMCTADGDHINFFAQFWLQGYSAADRSIRGLPLLQEVVFWYYWWYLSLVLNVCCFLPHLTHCLFPSRFTLMIPAMVTRLSRGSFARIAGYTCWHIDRAEYADQLIQ